MNNERPIDIVSDVMTFSELLRTYNMIMDSRIDIQELLENDLLESDREQIEMIDEMLKQLQVEFQERTFVEVKCGDLPF